MRTLSRSSSCIALALPLTSLLHVAPAFAQVTLQFDAAIPSNIVEEFKRYGIDIPQDGVKGVVHIRQGANGSLEVRFDKVDDTPEPGQAAPNEIQESSVTPVLPSLAGPATPSEPATGKIHPEVVIPQERDAIPAAFDGTWSVSLVANGGFLCSRVPSQTLTVQNGNVRGDASGVGVSGQVEPSGSISLALQKGGVRGSATGKLSGASGSGSWTAPSLGCSGQWTAKRQSAVTAHAN